MIAGMRRSEAGAFRTIVHQDIDPVAPTRILTGSETEKEDLQKMTAEQIAYYCRHADAGTPPKAFHAKIGNSEYKKKNIKRNPQLCLPQIGKNKIKKWIGPRLIDFCK